MLNNLLKQKILILDGAMGSNIQKFNLNEDDYRASIFKNHPIDLKGNNDVLSLTRPDVISDIHERFLLAGADIIETNTFSSNAVSQKEYHLTDMIKELNSASAKIAKKIAKKYSTPDKPRLVAGSIGPTGKTASISPDVENPSYVVIAPSHFIYKQDFRDMIEHHIESKNDITVLYHNTTNADRR